MDKSTGYETFGRCVAIHRDAEETFCALGNMVDEIPKALDCEDDTKYFELLVNMLAQIKFLEQTLLAEYKDNLCAAISSVAKDNQVTPVSVDIADNIEAK